MFQCIRFCGIDSKHSPYMMDYNSLWHNVDRFHGLLSLFHHNQDLGEPNVDWLSGAEHFLEQFLMALVKIL